MSFVFKPAVSSCNCCLMSSVEMQSEPLSTTKVRVPRLQPIRPALLPACQYHTTLLKPTDHDRGAPWHHCRVLQVQWSRLADTGQKYTSDHILITWKEMRFLVQEALHSTVIPPQSWRTNYQPDRTNLQLSPHWGRKQFRELHTMAHQE